MLGVFEGSGSANPLIQHETINKLYELYEFTAYSI